VGIVFGVARLEPRSNSASAGAEPGGIKAPVNYPFISRVLEVGIVFGVARLGIGKIVCSSLRNFLTPKNFGLCRAQIKTPRFARRTVICLKGKEPSLFFG